MNLSEAELEIVRLWAGVASFERGLEQDEQDLACRLGLEVTDDGWTVRHPRGSTPKTSA